MALETQIAFEGTKEEQELAARAFDVIKRKHILHGVNAPIKMSLSAIVDALTKAGGPMAGQKPQDVAPKLGKALRHNSAVFAEGDNGEFVTTKAGHAPGLGASQNAHTFKQRLNVEAKALDAEEAKEYQSSLVNRTANRAERSSILESVPEPPTPSPIRPAYPAPISTPYTRSSEIPTLIPQAHVVKEREPEEVQAVPSTPAPITPAARPQEPAPVTSAAHAAAPAAPAAPAATAASQAQAPAVAVPTAPVTPVTPAIPPARPTTKRAEETPARRSTEPAPAAPAATPQAPTQPRAAQAPSVEEAPTAQAQPVAPEKPAEAVTEKPATVAPPPPKPVAPVAPPQPVITGPIEVAIPSENGPITIDLVKPVDEILANEEVAAALEAMISEAVAANDTRLIRFGSDIFPEEATERFSKGDFRRIKEYLEEPETGGVASDRDIMDYVLGRRMDHPDYERLRFSLDYRMLKEKKDFEFVGVDSDRLWINAGTSPVLPPVRKPAEIGQDYRFLEDPATTWAEEEEEAARDYTGGPIDYSLTYYEYENGVLPYDRRFKRVFPGAVFEDQRSSLIRFEIPQLYGSLLAELRYPTGNRGGFIMGMGELFTNHMVPGAKFTITPTDRGEDVYEIHFTRIEEREENLLQLDERKGRYVFRPVSFAVETDPSMLLTQEKVGKLHNQKKLEESERRRPDFIITSAFEGVGEENEGKLWAIFDDIFPIVNLERPISRSWLRTLLSGAYPFFYPDETTEGAYFYDASKRPS